MPTLSVAVVSRTTRQGRFSNIHRRTIPCARVPSVLSAARVRGILVILGRLERSLDGARFPAKTIFEGVGSQKSRATGQRTSEAHFEHL